MVLSMAALTCCTVYTGRRPIPMSRLAEGDRFVMPGNEGDFKFAGEISDRTGADVWLVWHKLLPDVDGKGLLESVLCVYREALKRYEAKNSFLIKLALLNLFSNFLNSISNFFCFSSCEDIFSNIFL